MRENFSVCLAQVLKFEGGKSDNRADPGGRTNQGVTHATYDAYRVGKGLLTQDVYHLAPVERDEIYRHRYWDKVEGDDLPDGADLALFDFAVNSGPDRALRMWHEIDKRPGAMVGPSITKLCNARLAFMKGLATWPTFGSGWSKRVAQVEKQALDMASGKTVPLHKRLPNGSPAAGAVIGTGAGTAAAAANYDVGIAWVIGIAILSLAAATSIMLTAWEMRPAGAAKAHEADLPIDQPVGIDLIVRDLDAALANLAVKKADYDAAIATVTSERERVKTRLATLEAAVAGIDGKLAAAIAVEPVKPPTAPAAAPMQDVKAPQKGPLTYLPDQT